MTFNDWLDESKDRIDDYGFRTGSAEAAKAFWTGVLSRIGRKWNYGTSIWEREWDVLLVLDTCRPDVLEEVAHEYDYIPETVPTMNSLGSASPEWLAKNFTKEYASEYLTNIHETAYVTANLFSNGLEPEEVFPHANFDPELFYLCDEVWRYGWDDEYDTTPPAVMADRTIDIHREHDPNRLIVHFMQPHTPYRKLYEKYPEWFDSTHTGDKDDAPHRRDRDWRLWERLRHNVISKQEVWNAYKDNLRWVLNEGVEPVLENVDAGTVAITADHGEAFGEWGLYAHPHYAPAPVLKRVPWVKTTATDNGGYEPQIKPDDTVLNDDEVSERLQALGYK